MNTKNTTTIAGRSLIAGVACVLLGILFSVKSEVSSRNSLTNDEVYTIIKKTNEAFDLAEKNILKSKPDNPDDNVECSCNGTGVIVHGDGHETPCPCEVCECEAPPTTPPEEDCTPVFQRGLLRRLFKR